MIDFEPEHEQFRTSVAAFFEREAVPNAPAWESAGIVDRNLFKRAGDNGFLGMEVPEQFGGGGVRDFRFNMVIAEEIQRLGLGGSGIGLTLHNDICIPYFLHLGTPEQKLRWLPGMCNGTVITAIAMTEPEMGSDLASMKTTAIRDGDVYVVNGAKTFITNGLNADVVIVAVKTDPTQRHSGMSLLVVERGMQGFERGRNLDKIGLHSQDTAELFLTDVRVPVANLLGEEGAGFASLVLHLPQERLSIAVAAIAGARAAFDLTLEYTKQRKAFGTSIGSFQYNRFSLAEMATEIEIGQCFIDRCAQALDRGSLTAEDAAMAKWWSTELQGRVVDQCVQLHGGYGYMTDFPIARSYTDARVTRIYGGTTEIMKEIIGRRLGV